MNRPIGKKAKNLQLLKQEGYSVPNFFVVSSEDTKVSSSILTKQFFTTFGSLYANKLYAVRSSSNLEDLDDFSFAGMYDSFLNVPHHEVEQKIKAVQDSATSERVLFYLKKNTIAEAPKVSVIVQEMIDADVSGVGFGLHPVTKAQKHIINYVSGLGDQLVSGEKNAFEATIFNDEISRLKVDDLITNEQLLEISKNLTLLEKRFGKPQDIEFCFKANKFYLLQSRAITSIGEYIVWDNSNIVESYPGVTTPLTFSFITKMYSVVYKQFVSLLGVSEKQIDKHNEVFNNTLGLVKGRVYYNLLSWYKMLAMVPGYSINAGFMEQMMGVKESFNLKDEFKLSKNVARIRIVWMVFNMIYLQLTLKKRSKKFVTSFHSTLSEFKSLPYKDMTPNEIMERYHQFEDRVLLHWKAPLINDFFSMIWYGLLKKQAETLFPTLPNLHNNLLCGSQNIISVQPVYESMDIVSEIKLNQPANELFLNKPPEDVWIELQRDSEYSMILNSINTYLNKFGERCVGELKLETEPLSHNPSIYIHQLQQYLVNGVLYSREDKTDDVSIRQQAEEQLSQQSKSLSQFKKWLFKLIVSQARYHVSNRENLRFERTKAFGMVRTMMLALGNSLAKEKLITTQKDIFYLNLKELEDIDNQKQHFIKLIKERKLVFENYRNSGVPPSRFSTYGYDFTNETIFSKTKSTEVNSDLDGIGCSPGIVEAKVIVVENPADCSHLQGAILVARSTDPGWITLFPTASGLLVERGSLLSHSAIVSREMGIPCIVSIDNLLSNLVTGDLVRMDGSTGKIKRIDEFSKTEVR